MDNEGTLAPNAKPQGGNVYIGTQGKIQFLTSEPRIPKNLWFLRTWLIDVRKLPYCQGPLIF
jgi:hypothetical protein